MKMKKLIASILCIALVLSTMGLTAFAEEVTEVSTVAALKDALSLGKNILLTNDIDLNNEDWEPVSYGGVFDGGNFTIKNSKLTNPIPTMLVSSNP